MTEIIARIIFRQALIETQKLACSCNDFHARNPLACHTIANDLNAAGVRCDIAAQLARARRGEVYGVEQSFCLRELLKLFCHDAGLAND